MLRSARALPYRLPLTRPLVTSAGTFRVRRGILIRLEDQEGHVAWGEAAPLPGFSAESVGEASFALGQALGVVEGEPPPARVQAITMLLDDIVDAALGHRALPPSVRFGLEQALLDLLAQRKELPVAALLSSEWRRELALSRLVADPDEARAAVDQGLTSVKLKLTGPVKEAVAHARAVREAVGPDVDLRLDANQGYDLDDARRLLERLRPLRPHCVEEPLRNPDPDGLCALRDAGVPVAADESVRDPRDLGALLSARAIDMVVLKPAFLGGLLPALRLARQASAAGVGVVVTSVVDSAVGRRGAAHLAAAVPPGALQPCGLDTGGWLARDVAGDPVRRGGMWVLDDTPGLGAVRPGPEPP
ncbi:MAG: o-succinylbenzoate synthase [Alphaproteobacteria bacterium]|nr:o-succinylbenzoate synthase [Alphaproteobacteria bacterium]